MVSLIKGICLTKAPGWNLCAYNDWWYIYQDGRKLYDGEQAHQLLDLLGKKDLPIERAIVFDVFDVLPHLNTKTLKMLRLDKDFTDCGLLKKHGHVPNISKFSLTWCEIGPELKKLVDGQTLQLESGMRNMKL